MTGLTARPQQRQASCCRHCIHSIPPHRRRHRRGVQRQLRQHSVPPAHAALAGDLPALKQRQQPSEPHIRHLARLAYGLAVCGVASMWCAMPHGAGPLLASATATAGATGASLAISSSTSGMAAGFLHTLCGPDHLAALTPLTIGRNRFAASLLGSLWGLGHSTGQLVLGLLFVALKEQFTNFLPFLERWGGAIVGLTLITIGGVGIVESRTAARSAAASTDGSTDESVSEDEAALREITADAGKSEARRAVATYATGILYGLQPDALFVVIPALALPSRAAAFAYCVMFVIGTVVAMGGYTLCIGTASEELCRDRPWLRQNLSTGASCVALAVGGAILATAFGVNVPFFAA